MSQNTIPTQLTEQLARRNCVILLGPQTDPAGLTRALIAECNYPSAKTDHSLPAVARYFEAMTDRNQLIIRLRDWLESHGRQPAALHQAVAQLPVNRIVDFGYDSQLEAALHEAKRSYSPVVQDHELPQANRSRTWLLKPFGLADQPDSLVLTEDDHIHFLTAFDPSHPLLLNQLRVWAATQVLLWLGMNPADSYWQRLHKSMTADLNPRHRREYALAANQTEAEAWTAQGVTALIIPDPAAWLAELGRAVADLPPPPADTIPGPGPLLNRRPYKFLNFYTAEDADLFFGREQWIDDLTGRILARPLTVLFGQSGVGKTSLLLAGVTPRLQQRNCLPIYARPGDDPLASLRAAALQVVALDNLPAVEQTDLAAITDLGQLIQAVAECTGRMPVIILDQAEECFTALAPPVRALFVKSLAAAIKQTTGLARWVLSLREDFAAELHDWTGQLPTLFNQTTRLTALARQEAREAIARPPQRVGGEIEPALVEQLLADLTLDSVAPAQLQIVCDRLYEARTGGNRLTLAGYRAMGGARQILADYVDLALAQLPRAERELAVELLKAMVTGRKTKLPLRPAEILGRVKGDPAAKQEVLTGLVRARLVRSLEWQGERHYELAHEVLVDKIRGWIDQLEQQAHTARDILRQEQASWQQFETVPEQEKIAYLHAQRDNPYLELAGPDLNLILRAALSHGLEPAYWTGRAAAEGLDPWPVLLPALENKQEQVRRHALLALANWHDPRALERLRQGIADPAPLVRVTAHQSLYRLNTPEALAVLDASDDLRLVPAGEFTMGEENEVHPVYLAAYFIEKYPVTNKKYAQFIEAGGYEQPEYWPRTGWRWRQRQKRSQPAEWDSKKELLDHPVVFITWYEAWAYARWAGRRLLTEAEWEKAASWAEVQGRGEAEGRKRLYPWGDEFEQERCNIGAGIFGGGKTTPVGAFSPLGDSPCNCVDMAGNVWEWSSSLYQAYPYQAADGRENPDASGNRVLRGGSFSSGENTARCVYRSRNPPGPTFDGYGVRCGVGVE